MPAISVADAQAQGAEHRGVFSTSISLGGADGAIVLSLSQLRSEYQAADALNAALQGLKAVAASRYGLCGLPDRADASRTAIGPFVPTEVAANDQIIMFPVRIGQSADEIVKGMQQGPRINNHGVALLVKTDDTAAVMETMATGVQGLLRTLSALPFNRRSVLPALDAMSASLQRALKSLEKELAK